MFSLFYFCNWVGSRQWNPWFCHLLFLIELSWRTPGAAWVGKHNQEPGRKATMAKGLWAADAIELRRTKWWRYQNYLSGIRKNHRQGLKQDPQTLQLELRLWQLEMSEKELKESIKYELKALQKNESNVWKFSQKGKETNFRLKIVEDNIYKAFPHLGKPPRCSTLNQQRLFWGSW